MYQRQIAEKKQDKAKCIDSVQILTFWGGLESYNVWRINTDVGILPRLYDCEGGSDSTVTSNEKMRIPNEKIYFSKVNKIVLQPLSHLQLCDPMDCSTQASLSFAISQRLLKLMSIELVMPSNHLILCHPLLLLPSIFPSIRVFFNESALRIKWPEYWSFSFSISLPMKMSLCRKPVTTDMPVRREKSLLNHQVTT